MKLGVMVPQIQTKEGPLKEVTFLSQMTYSMILYNWVSASPEVSIEV